MATVTEGGCVWLPGPVQEALKKAWPVPQPPAGVFPTRGWTQRGQDRRPVALELPARPRDNPASPTPELSPGAFMNGPASQAADWLSPGRRGPISGPGLPVSAWGLRP